MNFNTALEASGYLQALNHACWIREAEHHKLTRQIQQRVEDELEALKKGGV